MSGANWNCKTDEERERLLQTTSALGWKTRPYYVTGCQCVAGCDACRPPPENAAAYLVWRDNPAAYCRSRDIADLQSATALPAFAPWYYYPPLQ